MDHGNVWHNCKVLTLKHRPKSVHMTCTLKNTSTIHWNISATVSKSASYSLRNFQFKYLSSICLQYAKYNPYTKHQKAQERTKMLQTCQKGNLWLWEREGENSISILFYKEFNKYALTLHVRSISAVVRIEGNRVMSHKRWYVCATPK